MVLPPASTASAVCRPQQPKAAVAYMFVYDDHTTNGNQAGQGCSRNHSDKTCYLPMTGVRGTSKRYSNLSSSHCLHCRRQMLSRWRHTQRTTRCRRHRFPMQIPAALLHASLVSATKATDIERMARQVKNTSFSVMLTDIAESSAAARLQTHCHRFCGNAFAVEPADG